MYTTVLSIMPQCELFRGCSTQNYQLIADLLQFSTFTPETTILQAGHSERALWVVLSGQCRVVGITQDGVEIELAQLSPSSIFGELSFFVPAAHRVSVLTKTDVKVAQLLREDFDTLASNNVELAHQLTCNAASILARRLHRMDELICRTVVEARIAHQSEWQEFCQLMHITPECT
ncbi:Crp/Fnr family transcriptional regulator [Gimesia algae]|uniref:cAMP receptor protein n=1 Tax=Gimesia algae TaxID=2527971 RepID=A0A517VKU1_9PLAN|nr:cyclic nucleotide-binding domain-containing protein [Gimesia algae]QDT93639.1 cAMP receptor protein [Gimesia algae]